MDNVDRREDLSSARADIDRVDREMARLFEARMDAVRTVAAWKEARDLPIEDPAREEAMLRRLTEGLGSPEYEEYYVDFLRQVLRISKAFQQRLREK